MHPINKPPVWAAQPIVDPQTQRTLDLIAKDRRNAAELEETERQQTEGKRFADAQHPRGYKHD